MTTTTAQKASTAFALATSLFMAVAIKAEPAVAAPPHQTNILLGAAAVLGDHIVENGRGQTVTVKCINPIKYDQAQLVDTYTTIVGSGFPLPPGAVPVGALSGARYAHDCKTTAADCVAAAQELAANYALYAGQFNARNTFAQQATTLLTNASSQYDYLSAQTAQQNDASAPQLDPTIVTCLHDIVAYAAWLQPGADSTNPPPAILANVSGDCPGAPAFSNSVIGTYNVLFSNLSAYETQIAALRIQLDLSSNGTLLTAAAPAGSTQIQVQNGSLFSIGSEIVIGGTTPETEIISATSTTTVSFANKLTSDHAIGAAITSNIAAQATSLKSTLQDIDLSSDLATGSAGIALRTTEQGLIPFSDVDLNQNTAHVDVDCHQYRIDGVSHALVLTASNRFSSSSNLSQSIATVDCPGAFAVSAGAGISQVPVVTYQLASTLGGTPAAPTATYTVSQQIRSEQTVAVAMFHYLALPLGGQTGLFVTGGFGTSTSQVDAFYGASLSLGRRLFINFLEHNGTYNALQPGIPLNSAAPSSFTIPTIKQTTTRLAIVLSFGTPFSSGSSSATAPSSASATTTAKGGH